MGKAKKSSKHRANANVAGKGHGKGGNRVTNELEADLASLEESRRLKGCSLLCELYSNIESDAPLHQVASNKILGFLVMRLVDSSLDVR